MVWKRCDFLKLLWKKITTMDLRHLTCLQKLYIYILRTSWIFETPLFCNETKIIGGESRSQPGGVFSRPEGPSGEGKKGVSPCVGRGRGAPPPPPPRGNFEKIKQNGAIWSANQAFYTRANLASSLVILQPVLGLYPSPLFRTECLLWTKVVMRGCIPLPNPFQKFLSRLAYAI